MLQLSLIFRPGARDAEVHRRDALITAAAEATEGHLGQENWVSADGTLRNAAGFWRDAAALQAVSRHPPHLEAKRPYRRWYEGYQMVVSEVRTVRGGGRLGPRIPRRAGCGGRG